MACVHWINRGISIPRVNRIFHCGVHVTVCCCCVTVQGSKLRGSEGQNAPQLTLKAPRLLSVGAKFCSLFKVRYRYAIQRFPFAPVMATFAPRFYETGQKLLHINEVNFSPCRLCICHSFLWMTCGYMHRFNRVVSIPRVNRISKVTGIWNVSTSICMYVCVVPENDTWRHRSVEPVVYRWSGLAIFWPRLLGFDRIS